MAIYNSSDIISGNRRGVGVYGVKNVGTITVASNSTLATATTDTLPICYIPNNSFISSFVMWLPALGTSLTLNLVDNLASPTVYISASTVGAAGGTLSITNFILGVAGEQYGGTAVAIGGTPGTKEVVWANGTLLQLAVNTSSGVTSGATALQIVYLVEFSPVYQAS